MEKCIIVGAGTYGQVYAAYLSESYEVAGFIDDNAALHGTFVSGIEVLGNVPFSFDYLESHPETAVFVPIGNNDIRFRLLHQYQQQGCKIPAYVHRTAIIHPTVTLGQGVYVLPGASIMPFTTIGDFVMISMGVNIAHHVAIGTGCFFSQGSNIGASIAIGQKAYCGIACTVMTGVRKIGKSALIGAGAVVIKDIPDHAVVVGNPGKIIRYANP